MATTPSPPAGTGRGRRRNHHVPEIPNRPTFTGDMLLSVLVDSDANAAAGDPESLGADHAIEVFQNRVALFTGSSIKHTRLGEQLYPTMKRLGVPRAVSVACWARGHPRLPRWVHVAPKQYVTCWR